LRLIGRRREFSGQRAGLKIGCWGNWAVEARKFVVRVRRRYMRVGSPDFAAS